MNIESNASSGSISIETGSRRILRSLWIPKDDSNQFILPDGENEHDIAEATKRKTVRSIWLLVPLLLFSVTSSEGHILLQNPIPTAVYGLYICGSLLLSIYVGSVCIWRGRDSGRHTIYNRITGIVDTRKVFAFAKAYGHSAVLLLGTVAIRISLQILFIQNEQCLISGVEGLVPLIFLAWKSRRKLRRAGLSEMRTVSKGSFSVHREEGIRQDYKIAILIGLALWTASCMATFPRSTVICETSIARWTSIFQVMTVVLDICILTSAERCSEGLSKLNATILSGVSIFTGMICILSAPLVLFLSFMFKLTPATRLSEPLDLSFYKAFFWVSMITTCNLLLIGHLLYIGSVMSLLSAFAGVSVFLDIYLAISNRDNLTFLDSLRVVLASVSMLYLLLIVKSDPPKRRIYKPAVSSSRFSHSVYYVMGLAACLVLLGLFPDISGSGILYEHPIDALIYIADQGHEAWAMQAKQSRTLEEAITNYQQRYNRKPPPNFHIWYNFAIARNSDVIDDFDNIERDLAPFRTLDPGELRERTKEAVYDEYNEIGVIKIRGGKAIVDKRFEGHRWMMDVMVLMMEYFTFSLPDMDIPFNINDEPRVVVPYKEMQKLLSRQAPSLSDKLGKNWSMNTGDLLDESVADGYESSFENWSFRNNFKMYSTLACAPASPARQIRSWSSSLHCNRCVKPHSTSHFLANWNKAGDPCHQPDLANLHGFYQGPGSYKVTKKLLPVFSASKSQGYADILYPSIWGWDDPQRFRYAPNKDYPAPDYANKSNNLFWRGPASEGYSRSGEWRTFLRQRFVWMTGKGKQLLPIYLPVSKDSDKYVVKNIARSQLLKDPSLENSGLAVDTGFTLINQAEEEDKVYELKVFGTAEMEDFQANWQHKYLMSMDESSASRSFISLVQSNALPFRATIFREWFDDRLAAWKHFVPIDLRLHGLWSTLAYFGGRFGTIRSIEGMDAGEFIAESGRKWGSRTLRRDDMEIYLFRLLLEWGRMIDDERDQLGFELMASDTM